MRSSSRTQRSRAGVRARAVLSASALFVTGAVALSACGSDEPDTQAESVTIADQWVKAADSDMTAAFGVFTNDGEETATIVSGSSPSAGKVELHEMAMVDGEMVMQPKAGGIPIPAGESATLEPGGDHIMLMELPAAIEPGDEVDVTLTFDDGSTKEFTATAKEYSGAEEEYNPSPSMSPMN